MKLFVSSLSFSVSSDDLNTLFTQYGEVASANIINDKDTGRSRGFGFVEMSDESAKKAIQELDGMHFEGRTISVQEARPREDRGGSGGGGNRNFQSGGGGRSDFRKKW